MYDKIKYLSMYARLGIFGSFLIGISIGMLLGSYLFGLIISIIITFTFVPIIEKKLNPNPRNLTNDELNFKDTFRFLRLAAGIIFLIIICIEYLLK